MHHNEVVLGQFSCQGVPTAFEPDKQLLAIYTLK